MLKAAVSGSFHRHMSAIYNAVNELRGLGVDVLSPSDPRIVDHIGEFLFVASDKLRSIKLVQDRHFQAIRAADFLWLVCPEGYTGASVCAEIGYAQAVGTPIFSDHPPLDVTIRQYVKPAKSMSAVLDIAHLIRQEEESAPQHFLLDPEHTIENSIKNLERLKRLMAGSSQLERQYEESQIGEARRSIRAALA